MSDSKSKDKSKRGLFGWFGKKDSTESSSHSDSEHSPEEEALEEAEHQLEEQIEEQVEQDIEEAYHEKEQDQHIEQDSFESQAPTLTPSISEQNDELQSDLEPTEKKGFFARLKAGLSRTRGQLADSLANLVLGSKEIDDDLLEDIETQLLMADVGVSATRKIIDDLTEKAERKELKDPQALMERLRQLLSEIIEPCSEPLELNHKPFVILMVGVNGVGKTTTIGKLAKKFLGLFTYK